MRHILKKNLEFGLFLHLSFTAVTFSLMSAVVRCKNQPLLHDRLRLAGL